MDVDEASRQRLARSTIPRSLKAEAIPCRGRSTRGQWRTTGAPLDGTKAIQVWEGGGKYRGRLPSLANPSTEQLPLIYPADRVRSDGPR
jgi:hypothetical protein